MTLPRSRRKRSLLGQIQPRRAAKNNQQLKLESLEQRQLLAVGPQLLGIQPNTGSLLVNGDVRDIAPNSLTFNFDDNQTLDANTLDGIRLSRSGADGIWGTTDDVIVTPGHLGIGDRPSEVIMRFAETLPDDQYRIEVFGFDAPSQGITALRNDLGEAFMPANPADDRATIDFELDLGAQIVSVVPQPITRNGDGSLSQARNEIVIYFNDDPLHDTAVTTGDLPTDPTVVDRDFYQLISTFNSTGVSTVTNTDDVATLPDSISYDPALNRAVLTFPQDLSMLQGEGVYRLRVGTTEVIPAPPVDLSPGIDPGDSFDMAQTAGTLSGGAIIRETISPQFFALEFPGANDEPGHRDVTVANHFLLGDGAGDGAPGVTTQPYNFQDVYGVDPNTGEPFHNVITEEQKQRAREIFQIYSYYLGIQFVETETQGMTVATGDLRAADPNTPSAPGGVAGLGGPGLAVMDRAETWTDGYGGSWFNVALHEIGHAIGQGHTYDLPPGTIQGDTALAGYGVPSEPVYPGSHDLVHGRHLHRPEGKDIDLYQFDVAEAGQFTADIVAERLSDSSFLNSALTLYRENSDGSREVIARNDDYNSEDAHLDLSLEAGTYFIAVSASGNTDFDPNRVDSGIGGRSEGPYELRLNFREIADEVLLDATGTAFDGDADGAPGGVYNFWLTAADQANTIYVDKTNQPSQGQPQPDGTLGNPFNEIDVAFAAASPGDVVRIVGNGGADGNLDTLSDNRAYLVGSNPFGNGSLEDGASIRAPQGVTVMIDAGAIFKVNQSFISTGSNNVVTDRSGSALQVLGTPNQSVYFTSYHDESIGLDTNPAVFQTPNPGNWGGIVVRNDVDAAEGRFNAERRGVFLNYINHADIRYGGGRVTLGSVPQNVSPIFVSEARPTISFNSITSSASAAISADPNSFEESAFLAPEFQIVPFTPTYSRVGPDIHGNRLLENSINGLFIRIATPDGNSLKPLTVSARFDDTDIVHVLAENLQVKGTPGGGISDSTAPPIVLVTLSEETGGLLPPGSYSYVVTYVDSSGNESAPSSPTDVIVTSGGSVQLNDLPSATTPFVGRRIYRSTNGGAFELVAQIGPSNNTFLDTGATDGGELQAAGQIRARLNARLAIDPNTIIKSNGARIDVTDGGTLIAEGLDGREVIFTSLNDDTFGAGGTLDTNNDAGIFAPAAGDWSGIFVGHTSSASFDRAMFAYGGGDAPLDGNTGSSNVIEVHQSTVRVANSEFRDNANGIGGSRTGRPSNAAATIFVRGAQPIIVSNIFRDNDGNVISINADALNHELNTDYGRATGMVDATPGFLGNQGPLIRLNRLSNNGTNGMEVRQATLTTQSVWDDTDMVHVVRGEIVVPDFHTYGGLRLQSSPTESLVVKLSGANAGFTATGRYLDIDDRIGGSVQVIGQPGRPVILTSLGDSTVGAGFDIDGLPQTDTANNGNSTAAPGDWNGITFAQNANDRNVSVVTEFESPTLAAPGSNALPDTAQQLGLLARGEQSSDDVNRLGFEIHGQLNEKSDVDVYSFNATAGTLVWLDIDRTRHSLDTVVELVDDTGQVLARADNSLDIEAGLETPFELNGSIRASGLISNAQRPKDYWTTNPTDAGMRVVLPGAVGSTGLFYIRVRSSSDNVPTQLLGGETSGKYQLQLRLRDTDEIPGSQIKFADIRYATHGVTVEGQPQHSPLLGEQNEISTGHNTPGTAQQLGNLLSTDRAALSVSAELSGTNEVDFFQFDVEFDGTQMPVDGWTSVTFDIDYADGLGRPDTILSIFDENQALVYTSRNAAINQDVPAPLNNSDLDDLSRGSVGTLDPFIGPVSLRTGTYYAAVTSNSILPSQLDQFYTNAATNPNVRLEPVNSTVRIAEDHINTTYTSTAVAPQVPVLFDDDSFVPYHLGDVTLFVVEDIDTNRTRLRTIDPFTGARENVVGTFGYDVGDLAMRSDGVLTAFTRDLEDNNINDAQADFLEINTGTAALDAQTDDQIRTYQDDGMGTAVAANDGIHYNAMTFRDTGNGRQLFAVGERAGRNVAGIADQENILYMFGDNGVATSNGGDRAMADWLQGAGTQRVERGVIDTFAGGGLGGTITGMTMVDGLFGDRMFAVSDRGDLFELTGFTTRNVQTDWIANITDGQFGFSVDFAALTVGPDSINVDPLTGDGQHEFTLIGISEFGDLHAFDVDGVPVPTFVNGASSISTQLSNVRGLAFSTLDVNPWHFTDDRDDRRVAENFGHGVTTAPDDSRANFDFANGSSLYFGRNNGNGFADNDYDFPGGAHGSVVSNPFSLEGYASADQPVLYFNYFLDTEGAQYNPQGNNPTDMRDSLRAYVQDDEGQWRLVATNNEFRSNNFLDEFDVGGVAVLHDNIDNTPDFWRQARVDLSQFAGMADLRLRFDFDTAGGLNMGDDLFNFGTPSGLTTGSELHAIPGLDIRDGDVFTLADDQFNFTTFEFESGFTLVTPTGAAITDGETFSITEPASGTVVYEFDTMGNGIGAGSDVQISINGGMSPAEVAQAILGNLVGVTPPFSLAAEGNDTIFEAVPTGLVNSGTLTGTGTIGDNPNLIFPGRDVDMMSIDLFAGDTIRVDIDLDTLGDSILRLFNSAGTQLRVSDDDIAPGEFGGLDSYIEFTAPVDDTYYLGVSGYSNFVYNPFVEDSSNLFNASTGTYTFSIELNGGAPPPGGSEFVAHLNGERLNLENVTNVTQSVAPALIVEGSPGTGNFPVVVHEDMTSEEVAQAIQLAFANLLAGGNLDSVVRDRDMIRLIGHRAIDQGPLGLADELYGDQFGAFTASTQLDGSTSGGFPGFLRGQDNDHRGAYIDDIVIGFAERGEMVTNAQAGADNFFLNPERNDNDNILGRYQLEIRRSEEFGQPIDPPPDQLPFFELFRAFDTNDRLAQQLSLQATPGYDIAPGDTFSLSDQAYDLTFEFTDTGAVTPGNVPVFFQSSDDAAGIARRIRDTINSPAVRNVLDLVASDSTGSLAADSTSSIVHLYGEASLIGQVGDRLTPILVNAVGDSNRFRDQGMIVIQTSYITDASGWGVRNLPGDVNQTSSPLAGQFPHAAPSRVLNVPNLNNLAPGIAITNNVIARNEGGGIDFAGDATGEGAVPLGRIVNNTIVGAGTGTGVRVRDNASPTLLNNIVSMFANGIDTTGNGQPVVVNGTVFQDNGANGTTGSNARLLASGAPLFRDAASGNYYLEVGSEAIDSAIDSMNDRPALVQVRAAVGISDSPVKSPDTDITGQLRTDDFDTPNTGGGQNPFKDRGALERADSAGPTVVLVNPVDNDAEGNDLDPATSVVQSVSSTFANFEIQLVDVSTSGGSGVDPTTVSADSLTISQDGRLLTNGVDYSFSYSPTNGTIRLTPTAGIWNPGSVYVVEMNNEDRFVVDLPSGDAIADADQFTITDNNGITATYEFDSGFTLQVPQTLTLTVPPEGNAPGGVLDNQTFTLGSGGSNVRFEFNTGGGFTPTNIEVPITAGDGPEAIADAIVTAIGTQPQLGLSPRHLGGGVIHLGSTAGNTGNVAGTALTLVGIPEGLVDGDQVAVGDDTRTFTFEFNSVGGTQPGTRNIAFSAADTHEEIADRLAAAIAATSLGLTPTHFGGGFIHVGGEDFHTLDAGSSRLAVSSTPGVTGSIELTVPLEGGAPGGIADGEQFTITSPTGTTVFEFDSNGASTVPPEQTIGISAVSDQDDVAAQIVAILTNYAGLVGWPISPTDLGNGVIELGEPFGFSVDTSATALADTGIGGGAIAVDFVPHVSFDTPKVAESVRDTINAGAQTGVSARLRGGQSLVVEGATAVNGLTSTFVPAIRDLADNPLQANQASGETRFTILLGDPDLDFGDLPDPSFPTLFANNGARHALTNGLFLGTGVSADADGKPSTLADLDTFDDGVVFNDILNANVTTPITVTASAAGVLDAWLDFNGDGDFADPGEQIFVSKPIQAGDNDLTIMPASQVAAGMTHARFRISTSGNLTPAGLAPDGEVEDYVVEILGGTPPLAVDDDYTTDEDTSITIAAPGVFANDSDADGDQITLLTADAFSAFGALVSVGIDGSLTYDQTGLAQFDALPAGAILSDTFTYVATDGTLESNQAIVFVEVTGLNDAPTAVDDNYTVSEDAAFTLGPAGLLANDFDIDLGDTFELISIGGGGTLSGSSALGVPVTAGIDGSFSYDPTGVTAVQALSMGETATDTITYTVQDAAGETATATITITLVGANDSPIAVGDSYTVTEDTLLDVPAAGLLANDSDVDQDGTAPDDVISVITNTVVSSRGVTVEIDADGAFRYDPRTIPGIQSLAVNDQLIDTFNYRISDGNGGSDVATVSITVTGENDPPTANDDNYTISENFVLSVSTPGAVLNDTDIDAGDSITVIESDATSALGAVVVMQTDGSFTYNPTQAPGLQSLPAGATVSDTFTYKVEDQSGVTDTATVTVVVSGSNDAPVANDDADASYVISEDASLVITAVTLLSNDSDIDTGDTLSVQGVNGTTNLTGTTTEGASIQVNTDGTFTYDPGPSTSLQAMNAGDTMTDTFTYTVVDNNGLTDSAMVSIVVNGANDDPVAQPDSYTVSQDQVLTIDVNSGWLANDSDVDSANIEVTNVDVSGLEGALNANADGSFTYDPRGSAVLQSRPLGSSDTFTFTYTISDGDGGSATTTVTLTVTGVNDLPDAQDDSGFATDEETQITIAIGTLLANDSDPDGDPLTLTPPTVSDLGVPLTVNGANEIVYDPAGILDSLAQGQVVTDTFTYTVDDGNNATATATVSIEVTGLNDDPVVPPRSLQTTEDSPLTVVAPGLLVGATDPDQGDALTLVGVQNPSVLGATVTFAADGSVLYNPIAAATLQSIPAGDQLTDTFSFTVSDGKGGVVSQTATVTVLGVNDRPTTVADNYSAFEGSVLEVDVASGVLANDSDIDVGDTLTAAVANQTTNRGATVTMNLDGSFSYDPRTSSDIRSLATGEQLVDSFTYTATDSAGGSRTATVQVTVTGVNEHPWQNEILRFDVDASGFVSNSDALVIISRLRRTGPENLPVPPAPPITPPPFYDVNGDDRVTLNDALEVVSFLTQMLNAKTQGGGEGEGEGDSVAEAVEKASSQSVVSSASADIQPVKLAAKSVKIEEVVAAPSIDLYLASNSNAGDDDARVATASDSDDLDDTLESIVDDINDAWI